MAKNIRIVIGVPCHDMVAASFSQSICNLVEYMTRKKYEIVVQFYEGTIVTTARQRIAEFALSSKADYLFFMDSDMIIHQKTIEALINEDVDIVSTMFFKRVPPYSPCFYTEVRPEGDSALLMTPQGWDSDNVGLYRCHATGLAATLIKRSVLEALKGTRMFEHPLNDIGEDIAFCLNARAKGFQVWVDTRLEAGHIGKRVVTQQTFKEENKK